MYFCLFNMTSGTAHNDKALKRAAVQLAYPIRAAPTVPLQLLAGVLLVLNHSNHQKAVKGWH